MARLVPSTQVVEISSRINFYWYIEHANPFWYYRQYRRKIDQAKEEMMQPKRSSDLNKRGSWGGLEIAALAKVKAMADERKKMEKEVGFFAKLVGRMRGRFGPTTNTELKRHIAAAKIQRAWRRRLARPTDNQSMDGLDLQTVDDAGWKGRLNAASKKRSMLGNYYRQNGRNIRNGHENRDVLGQEHSSRRPGSRADSQVGTAMAEVTGQWVATIVVLGLILTLLFTYQERDATRPSTMAVLHGQIMLSDNESMARRAVETSINAVIPKLYSLESSTNLSGEIIKQSNPDLDGELRARDKLQIKVTDSRGETLGIFDNRGEKKDQALVELLLTFFVLCIWFLGVTAFAGPVMTLVITPIERMVRLLGMLMVDPLGYQSNPRFKKILLEEDALIKKSRWTKEVLKGMETSFLMSTILRIGSLMRVGFGSAGVEIIRNNLQKGQNKNMLMLTSQGSTVSCIFVFCDIRQFTDATECLQEEVFVFTNRIAAVVHSICHSYGGSANKNVGDAFLVVWLLDDESGSGQRFSRSSQALVAKHNQADKALLSVVKISMALYYDNYYVETMSNNARNALLTKLQDRPGPVVQMGFGLHAGKAVQGAIGSQRKIDATYVSEAVERAEYLESSTKKYRLKMLMSDTFHLLLEQRNRRRCRKIDQIMFVNEDDEDQDDDPSFDQGDIMELYTYDMDIDALWRGKRVSHHHDSVPIPEPEPLSRAASGGKTGQKGRGRRTSGRNFGGRRESGSDEMVAGNGENGVSMTAAAMLATEFSGSTYFDVDMNEDAVDPGELILPTGPALYSANAWLQEDMGRIRHQYTSVVFSTFDSGLQRYYSKDWAGARQSFESILELFEDGPSKYFLEQMKMHNWKPPPKFHHYGRA